MSVLAGITSPEDLRRIAPDKLPELASEIRDFLVHKVSKTGGHLGPNLGVVELTIALHRVFSSPYEPIIFDTGHQAYVHKMLTGRQAGFDQLRLRGGLSGYPNPTESEHDWTESSHASASLSYVDGLSKAFDVRGERRAVVGVIGDGALTGGMAWEALNNIASGRRPVVIVVNDNGRSYSPTIGGIATKLASLRLQPKYERVLLRMKNAVSATPVVGPAMYDALHGVKAGIKDILAPQGMFEDLGLKYVGPVDGHDEAAVERALQLAKDFDAPVLVHCVTHKGFGYPPAENHEEDQFHSPAAFDWETGQSLAVATTTWTNVFSDEIVKIGTDRSDVVAITAAMLYPTGLGAFAAAFPNRAFDVGIAEQHALTSAAGMAMGGLHPVVALYATFLNRAFDQFVMDIALHKQPVTIVLDRAGVTGTDGPSHNGMWDLALLAGVPGVRIAAPRDGQRLRQQLRQAVDVSDGPTVLRFSKGSEIAPIAAIETHDGYEVLHRGAWNDVLLIAVGPMAAVALDVAKRAADQGVAVTVVDPGWVIPVSAGLRELTRDYKLVVTVEDGLRVGGVGSVIAQCMSDSDIDVPVHNVGIPNEFLQHGSRDQVLADCGLTAQAIARNVVAWSARLDGQSTHPNPSAPANVQDETSDLGDTQ